MIYLYNHDNGAPLDYWTLEFREVKGVAFYCIALHCVLHLS